MKLRYLGFIACLALSLAPLTLRAASAEAITNISQSLSLDESNILSVTEVIDYDFGTTPPHNLLYRIPISYHDDQGREFKMSFNLTSAKLNDAPITIIPEITTAQAALTLPANNSPSTLRRYVLQYTIGPVAIQGETRELLKLTVTGLGWDVPINHATVRLDTHTAAADNLTCYTGASGSTTSACVVKQAGNVATIETSSALAPGEALSIFADFPAGTFKNHLEADDTTSPWFWPIVVGVGLLGFIGLVVLPVKLLGRRRRRSAGE